MPGFSPDMLRGAILDGATGTYMPLVAAEMGTSFTGPADFLNLEQPALIQEMKRRYGGVADAVQTATFNGNILTLGAHRPEITPDEAWQINQAAVDNVRAVVPDHVLIAGDIGPLPGLLRPYGSIDPDAARTAYREQAAALLDRGARYLHAETMQNIAMMEQAILGIRDADPGAPILATMTFDWKGQKGHRTLFGETPDQFAQFCAEQAVDMIGLNCGNGLDHVEEAIAAMRAVGGRDIVIAAKPNLGKPVLVEGVETYPEATEANVMVFARAARDADAVGLCCGSTPELIGFLRDARAGLFNS